MTVVVGVVTPRGVVIGADGLGTFGDVQMPRDKIYSIGGCFAGGVAGNLHIAKVMIDGLRVSPLGTAHRTTFTIAEATRAARLAVQTALLAYSSTLITVPGVTFENQIGGAARVLVGGLCSDGQMLVTLDQNANGFPPIQPHYTAIGSADQVALLLLQAYSAFDFTVHPLDSSVLLVKRVLDQISAAIPNIGGTTGMAAIATQPAPGANHLTIIDGTSAQLQDGLTTWKVAEGEMFADLAAWSLHPPALPAEPPPPPPPPAAPPLAAAPGPVPVSPKP